jgi:peptide/nickel transport system permease protein
MPASILSRSFQRSDTENVLGYMTQRLLVLVPTVVGVTTIVFLLLHLMPGDPVDIILGETAAPADRVELRRQLGLDRPLLEQYSAFMAGLLAGDLGQSFHGGRPVAAMVSERYPATLGLASAAMVVALATALPLGLLAAARPRGLVDRSSLGVSLLGVAIPNFWLGPMLIMVFAVELGWLPVSGAGSSAHLVLPAITLGLSMAGILTRMTRTTVLEALHEEYVRTARAKGASELSVLCRHALANAVTPMLSIVGLQFGALLAGSVITESIFAWPGLGRLTVQAIYTRDYPVVQGCVLVIALSYVLVNLLTDLAYAWVNPRIRLQAHG